jgi:primosomal replication protein N
VNRTDLSAKIVERTVLRYTPAGIPVCECLLRHESVQVEAAHERQVELDLNAVALGPLALELERAGLGALHKFTGFLAKKSRKSRSFVYHITAFELENEE